MLSFVYHTITSILTFPFKTLRFMLSVPLWLPIPLWIAIFVLVAYLLIRRPRLAKRCTPCTCSCILITPYSSNGVKTDPIVGCLYCDHSNQLQKAAERTIASLRSKRNSHGFWAFTGATCSFLGHVTTGPLFEILSGSSVGVAVKTGRFFCINSAVNSLKPFLANVLVNRPHIAHCKCDPLATARAVSGVCDISGGKYDGLVNMAPDGKTVHFDKQELRDYMQSELDAGSSIFDQVLGSVSGVLENFA